MRGVIYSLIFDWLENSKEVETIFLIESTSLFLV